MRISSLKKEDVFKTLVTTENGLNGDEAKRRLLEFGPNEIQEAAKTSLIIKFLKQFTHFLAILLWAGASLAFISELLHPGEGMITLGLAIVGVICVNAVFTFIQEYKAEKSIEKLRLLLPFNVNVIREGLEKQVSANEIVPGDVIILSEGNKVPADARLFETARLMVNNASLTGESESVPLQNEPFDGELFESKNVVLAGATIVSGSGKAVVFSTGMRTEFGRIAHLTSSVEAGMTPLQKEIIKVSRIIAILATLTGVIFFLIGHFVGRSFWENFIFAIGVIIALVPEGLLPLVTMSLSMGSQRMAGKKALIKNLTSVEALGSVTVICTDKTGTLTQNKMEAKELWTMDSAMQSADILLKAAFLCNNTHLVEGRYSGDPTETAIYSYARGHLGDIVSERIAEIPFDSERKMMSTINKFDEKTFIFAKGAMESIFPLCVNAFADGKITPLREAHKKNALDNYNLMMDKGLRVLAFAFKECGNVDNATERDMVFAGFIGIEDPLRPEVHGAVIKCREAGIKIIMITGDSSRTAVAVARDAGIVRGEPVVVEGHDFLKMSDSELIERLSAKEIIFARMSPKHKMRVVSLLKDRGERVAVTGDGVNDAPALKKADVGIAMGIAGTDVAKEAADIILLDDNFASIVNAIEEGRAVYENIRKFIVYIFSSNIAELAPFLAYMLLHIPLPLTIIQILAVDLGTDMLPALALGAEKPAEGIMKQPPRDPNERLLNLKRIGLAFFLLGPIEAAAGLFGYFYVLETGGWQWGEMLPSDSILYMQATTACLTGIVVAQIANVFACRSFRESVFSLGLFTNRFLFVAVAVQIVMQLFIVYHPWGNAVFSTYPVSGSVWLMVVPFAASLFIADELRKLIIRNRG